MTYINLLQENFILITLLIVMSSIYFKNIKILKKTHKDKLTVGTFPKLGMLGTLIGLMYVFWNLNGGIHTVLPSLGLAMLSTLFGLLFDLSYASQANKYVAEGNNISMSGHLKEIAAEMKGMRSSISNPDDDSSLLSQMKLARTENNDSLKSIKSAFTGFAEQMAKNNTEALIKAVEQVMKDFNTKINNNLGDAFKSLNSSVENLVKWQTQYKDHLENLTGQIKNAISGIKDSDQALKNISESMKTLPESTNELKELSLYLGILSKEHEKHLNDLDNKLSAFADMKDKAINAMPHIEENLNSLTVGLKSNISNVITDIEKSSKIMEESVKDQQSNVTLLVEGVKDNIIKSTDGIEVSVNKTLSSIENNIELINKNTLESMKLGIENQQREITSLTSVFAKNIVESNNEIGNAVKGQLKTLTDGLNKQQEYLDKMTASIKNNISTSTDGLTEMVEKQMTAIKKAAVDLLAETNKSVVNMHDNVEANFKEFDQQTQQEITRAIQSLVKKVVGFQEEFIKVHGSMINTLKSTTNETIGQIQ